MNVIRMLVAILAAIFIPFGAAAQSTIGNELSGSGEPGYYVILDTNVSVGQYIIGNAFPTYLVGLEYPAGADLDGTLSACENQSFVASECDTILNLNADNHPSTTVLRTSRRYYIIDVTNEQTDDNTAPKLTIKGSYTISSPGEGGGGPVNLGTAVAPTTLTVTNDSGGSDAVLPAATPTTAGVMSASDKVALDNAGSNPFSQTIPAQVEHHVWSASQTEPATIFNSVGVSLSTPGFDCGPTTPGFPGSFDEWDEVNAKTGWSYNMPGPGGWSEANPLEHRMWNRWETAFCEVPEPSGSWHPWVEWNAQQNPPDVDITLTGISAGMDAAVEAALATHRLEDRRFQFSGSSRAYGYWLDYDPVGDTATIRIGIGKITPSNGDVINFGGETATMATFVESTARQMRIMNNVWDTITNRQTWSFSSEPNNLNAPSIWRAREGGGFAVNWRDSVAPGFQTSTSRPTQNVAPMKSYWDTDGADGAAYTNQLCLENLTGGFAGEAVIGNMVKFANGAEGNVTQYVASSSTCTPNGPRLTYEMNRPYYNTTPPAVSEQIRLYDQTADISEIHRPNMIPTAGVEVQLRYDGDNFIFRDYALGRFLTPDYSGTGNDWDRGKGLWWFDQRPPVTGDGSAIITVAAQGCLDTPCSTSGAHGVFHWQGGDHNSGHEVFGGTTTFSGGGDHRWRHQPDQTWREKEDSDPDSGTDGAFFVMGEGPTPLLSTGTVMIGAGPSGSSGADDSIKPSDVLGASEVLIGVAGNDPEVRVLDGSDIQTGTVPEPRIDSAIARLSDIGTITIQGSAPSGSCTIPNQVWNTGETPTDIWLCATGTWENVTP